MLKQLSLIISRAALAASLLLCGRQFLVAAATPGKTDRQAMTTPAASCRPLGCHASAHTLDRWLRQLSGRQSGLQLTQHKAEPPRVGTLYLLLQAALVVVVMWRQQQQQARSATTGQSAAARLQVMVQRRLLRTVLRCCAVSWMTTALLLWLGATGCVCATWMSSS